nr:hypothetical protein [uncultured Mucilaginibacter sp.]
MEELSKSDKRNAREIIIKGMHEEFRRGMESFYKLLEVWRTTTNEDQLHYAELYGSVKDFNKQIAWRYDGLKNSGLVDVLTGQLREHLIEEGDLNSLSDETRACVIRWANSVF